MIASLIGKWIQSNPERLIQRGIAAEKFQQPRKP